jgi:hypothetical protein
VAYVEEWHISTPHDSTQGLAEQRFIVIPASFAWHIEYNCTRNGSDVTCCTPDFFCREQEGLFNDRGKTFHIMFLSFVFKADFLCFL